MWSCPKCKAEVEDGFEVCWSCGTSPEGVENPNFVPDQEGVISEEEYEEETAAKRQEDLVVVETFWSAPEAHVLRSLLQAEGIHAVVTDDLATWGLLQDHGGIKLLVAAHDLERAQQVLAAHHHEETPEEKDEDNAE